MPSKKRDYKKEYREYHALPAQKKRRADRNAARRKAMAAGKVHKGDGMDVNHSDGNALQNTKSNWNVESKHSNRSYPRTRNAGKKNPRD